jgi:hypothetical protein
MIVNGTGNIAANNQIYATASQSYSIMFQAANCHQCILNGNHWNNNGSAYNDVQGDGMTITGNQTNKLTVINGSGSVYTNVLNNIIYSSGQLRLTGKCIPIGNSITGGWETITGAYGGSRNLTSSSIIDTVAVTTSGTYNPHVGVYANFLITANGNLTFSTPTNPIGGQTIRLVVLQDSTGGRAVSFSSDYITNGAVTTTANTRSTWTFVYDAAVSKFIQVGPILTGF